MGFCELNTVLVNIVEDLLLSLLEDHEGLVVEFAINLGLDNEFVDCLLCWVVPIGHIFVYEFFDRLIQTCAEVVEVRFGKQVLYIRVSENAVSVFLIVFFGQLSQEFDLWK